MYLGAHSLGGGSAFQDTTRYDYIGQGSVYHIDTYAGFNLQTFKFQHTKLPMPRTRAPLCMPYVLKRITRIANELD